MLLNSNVNLYENCALLAFHIQVFELQSKIQNMMKFTIEGKYKCKKVENQWKHWHNNFQKPHTVQQKSKHQHIKNTNVNVC